MVLGDYPRDGSPSNCELVGWNSPWDFPSVPVKTKGVENYRVDKIRSPDSLINEIKKRIKTV